MDGTDDTFVASPWTDQQLEFVNSSDPVRIVYGYPGSGKTTALWRAVESRDDERVLYTSWSRELVQFAGEHLATFAPTGLEVIHHDFLTFLGAICGHDIPRLTQEGSMSALAHAIGQARMGRTTLGPWAGRMDALHAEMRAVLFGMALEDSRLTATSEGLRRLADSDYLSMRGCEDGVGPRAARSLLKIAASLDERGALGDIFPELAGAAISLDRLTANRLPDGFSGLDRVVVDEAQDHTLVEIGVFVELCRAIARHRGHSPRLLLAGDEGQTVRPSGFDWGALNGLLADRLDRPREFLLEAKLRSPEPISAVIENASRMYAELARGLRPSNQRRLPESDAVDARLFHVGVPGESEALDLIGRLSTIDNLVIVVIDAVIPEWVRGELRSVVLTPQAVKGLEYQAVCVLDPGEALRSMMEPVSEHAVSPNLDHHLKRTSMDRFRVALSRSTESLVFLDVGAGDEERALSSEMLGQAVRCSPDDLVELLGEDDATPEERVLSRIGESRELVDADPAAAWNRAVQSFNLLGRAELPNGVADLSVRREAHENLLHVGSRILVDGAGTRGDRDEVDRLCFTAAEGLGAAHSRAFRELHAWIDGQRDTPLDLLDALIAPGGPRLWLGNSLPSAYQALQNGIERAASDPDLAGRFTGKVDGWLELSGYAGDLRTRADELRLAAFETLLEADSAGAARRVLDCVETETAARAAGEREREQRWMSAVILYDRAGMGEATDRARSTGVRDLLESAESLMESEGHSEAIKALNTALALNEDDLEARDLRGECLYQLGEYDLALTDYTHVIESGPSYEDIDQVYYGRALIYEERQQYDLALADCLKSIDIGPEDAETRVMAAQLYRREEALEEALEHAMRTAELEPDSVQAHFLLGDCHLMLGNLERALEHTLRASEIDEASDVIRRKLGEICSEMGALELALRHLDRAVELNPDRSLNFLYRGYVHESAGERDLALRDFNTALALDPDGEPVAYYRRARVHMGLEDFESAAADCNAALERGLESAALYTLRMQASYDLADFRGALRDCRAALRASGESEDLYVMMGHVYVSLASPELALREGYKRALELNPESPEALSGALSAAMLLEYPSTAQAGRDPTTEPVGVMQRALRRFLPVEPPADIDSEFMRLAQDGAFQETIPTPRSLLQDRRRPRPKGESG